MQTPSWQRLGMVLILSDIDPWSQTLPLEIPILFTSLRRFVREGSAFGFFGGQFGSLLCERNHQQA